VPFVTNIVMCDPRRNALLKEGTARVFAVVAGVSTTRAIVRNGCKIAPSSVRCRAELYYQQLDALVLLRQQAWQDLFADSKKHQLAGSPSSVGTDHE
jgi:hypothetical protein